MKKTDTNQSESKLSKLLSYNEQKASNQKRFLEQLCEKLNEISQLWRDFQLNSEFNLTDLSSIFNGVESDQFIKDKVISGIEVKEIGGIKMTPEKIYDLMEKPDFSEFIDAYHEMYEFIFDRVFTTESNRGLELATFGLEFFKKDSGKFIVNESELENWIERKCKIYTESESQVEMNELLTTICDCMNKLKQFNPRVHQGTTTDLLKTNPIFFTSDYSRRMINVNDQGEFYVVKEFVLKH